MEQEEEDAGPCASFRMKKPAVEGRKSAETHAICCPARRERGEGERDKGGVRDMQRRWVTETEERERTDREKATASEAEPRSDVDRLVCDDSSLQHPGSPGFPPVETAALAHQGCTKFRAESGI